MQIRSLIPILIGIASLAAQPNPGTVSRQGIGFNIPPPVLIDASGNFYLIGGAGDASHTTAGAAQTTPGGGTCGTLLHGIPLPCFDALIEKYDASGKKLFATLLGGPMNDGGIGLALDSAGNVYSIGVTAGSFPTTPNAAIPASTTSRTFAAKLSADGSAFLYSTYLPDVLASVAGIAADGHGNAIIVGSTAAKHVCVVKLSADGSTLLYTKILAGANQESAAAVAVDAAGNALVAGSTSSPDFPVSAGALQGNLAGAQNAFLMKLDPAGNIVFSTFLGGSGTDQATRLQLDAEGNIFIAGAAGSLDFPTTAGTYQPAPVVPAWARGPGGFIAKIAADGGSVQYATYVAPGVFAFGLGSSGDVFIAGGGGPGYPVTDSAPFACATGDSEIAEGDIILHLDAHGTLLDATYLPGDIVPVSVVAPAADGVGLALGSDFLKVRFGDPGWISPPCITLSILNSATLAVSQVVPGEFVSIVGRGIGPDEAVSAQPAANGSPTALGGVQVYFDEIAAPVLYAQSRQVNAQAPFELSGRDKTTVTLVYNGHLLPSFDVHVRFGYPGLFRLQPNVSALAAAVNQDGTINGPSHPAPPGSVISLWGTGFGSIDPGCPTGGMNPPVAVNLAQGMSVNISGGTVTYAGSAPGLPCGVIQINVQIPFDAPPGPRTMNPESQQNLNGRISVVDPSASGSFIYVK